MPLTNEQIIQEKKKEQQFNIFSEQIIGQTAWGKFYGLMREASKAGEGAINKKICLDKEGRNIIVYNTNTGKVIGTFLKPAHEQAGYYFGQKKYGKGALSLLGFGWIPKIKEQKEAKCVFLTPNEIIARQAGIERKLKKTETYRIVAIIFLVTALILIFYMVFRNNNK